MARGSRSPVALRRVIGAVLLAAAALGIGYPIWWSHRSATAGAALVAKAVQVRASTTHCPSSVATAAAPTSGPGVLEIPSIGLVAPVLDGLNDNVLNVAVGHNPGTRWPGEPGEALLEAHDVSYFANLGKIAPGAQVIWTTACLRATFQVIGSTVSYPGATVSTPASGSGLVLVTCYPTNALFWTNQRFIVTTKLVSEAIGPESRPKIPSTGTSLVVPAPPSLKAAGLDLDEDGNSLPLGTLALKGTPTRAWIEGPGPMQVEADALAVYFGAEKAVAAHNASWWSAITVSGLARPATWPFAGQTVNIAITMKGTTPQSVSIASSSASATLVVTAGVIRLAELS